MEKMVQSGGLTSNFGSSKKTAGKTMKRSGSAASESR